LDQFYAKLHDQIQEQPAKQGRRSVKGEKIWIKHNNNGSRITTVKFECENDEDIYTL
jgi:hypothetical protein